MTYQNKQAFTLIELLVVVLISGILAAVALPQYNKVVMKSRLTEYEQNLKAIAESVRICNLSKGSRCSTLEELDIEIPPCRPLPGYFSSCSYVLCAAGPGLPTVIGEDGKQWFSYALRGITSFSAYDENQGFLCVRDLDFGVATSICEQLGFTEDWTESYRRRSSN